MSYKVALWIDDVRPIPSNYLHQFHINRVIWCHSVNNAIDTFNQVNESLDNEIVFIDLDHDAGNYSQDGGDYIKFLDWLESIGIDMTKIDWRIHSFNPVGVKNMEQILKRNGVKHIYGLMV